MWIDSPPGKKERHAADAYDLVAAAYEMHFDPPLGGVVEGPVGELLDVEVGAQLAIDPHQDVAVERGRNASPVVVGGFHSALVLLQIDAEQEWRRVRTELPSVAARRAPASGAKLPSVEPGKYTTPSGGSLPADGQAQRPCEVDAQRQHLNLRVFLAQHGPSGASTRPKRRWARNRPGRATGREGGES